MARKRKIKIPCGGNLVGWQRIDPIARDSLQPGRGFRLGRFASVAANRSVDDLVAHMEAEGARPLHDSSRATPASVASEAPRLGLLCSLRGNHRCMTREEFSACGVVFRGAVFRISSC